MAQILLLCLVLADALVGLSMASTEAASSSFPEAPTPSEKENSHEAPSSMIRKLGKHQQHKLMPQSFFAPRLSPSMAPRAQEDARFTKENGSLHHRSSTAPYSTAEKSASILVQEIRLPKHHHSIDKSVAGAGVILGGLATTFLVAVFRYIRATRKHKAETSTYS